MQSKADKNLKSKGKKKDSNFNSIAQTRNKSAKCISFSQLKLNNLF